MAGSPPPFTTVLTTIALVLVTRTASAEPAAADEAKVKEIFEDACSSCHSGPGDPTTPDGFTLDVPLQSLARVKSAASGDLMIVPGDPDGSYLFRKLVGKDIEGEVMPMGDTLPEDQIAIVRAWITAVPPSAAKAPPEPEGTPETTDGTDDKKKKGRDPFNGTTQISLPTTATLHKRTLQFRLDHRFGRIGTERGAFGLDAGVYMAIGLAYGIFDGWDVQIRRANARKTWEFSTKYIPLRQEDGRPVSFGGWASFSLLRDFDVSNRYVGDFQLMLSRLWFDRWSTMLTFGYHMMTNHDPAPLVDFDDGAGPVPVRDRRDTVTVGVASTVWVDKRKRWGIDFEWVLPIPDGGKPNLFYYRGGDSDPAGSSIGAWSIGGSLKTAKHFFQVFFTNNRYTVTNLWAPGGQTGNPFKTPGVDSKNPFHHLNFYLGFNLARKFSL